MIKKGSRRSHNKGGEIDVTPVMNLFVVLIPFLLFSAVFAKIAVINISLPGTGEEQEIIKNNKMNSNVQVSVGVSVERLIVSVSGEVNYQNEILLDNEPEPLLKLHKMLVQVKEAFPQKRDILVIPDKKVKYEMIVNVLDTARLLLPDDPEIVSLDDQGNKVKLQSLFPDVIMGSI